MINVSNERRTSIKRRTVPLMELNLHTVVHADQKISVYPTLNGSKNISLGLTQFDLTYIEKINLTQLGLFSARGVYAVQILFLRHTSHY